MIFLAIINSATANIQQAHVHFQEAELKAFASDLFDRICFTVIIVQSEDLAFNFFDTQNNRGVRLNATDLLKAYHLRAIRGDSGDKECLQRDCAERWERLQKNIRQENAHPIFDHASDFAPTLFHKFLWRARRWSGQKSLVVHNTDDEAHDFILDEFQAHTFAADSSNTVPVYPPRTHSLGASLTVSSQGSIRLISLSLILSILQQNYLLLFASR